MLTDTMNEHLWYSRPQLVIDRCQELAIHPAAGSAAAKAATYFQDSLARMDYAYFRQKGYFIGSGPWKAAANKLAPCD